VDIPDPNGLDENGDGIDGVACNAVFVNLSVGSDLNEGLAQDDPVATLGRGIEIAGTYSPPRMVLVAAGSYAETVDLVSGVSLYGGYDPDSWDRDVFLNVTEIVGETDRAIVAQDLDQAVEVDGFTIIGKDFESDSLSTYGVWVRDTPEGLFTLDYCTVQAGNAGLGADGNDGSDGQDGGDGTNASGGSPGAGGDSVCDAVGGNGGSGLSCPSTSGQSGSAGLDNTPVGQGGSPGASECSGNTCGDEGANGTPGQSGNTGTNGEGGTIAAANTGSFDGSGYWVAPLGDTGTGGRNGSGGGGGGAGGYDVDSGVFAL
jgi:hypothetical protein